MPCRTDAFKSADEKIKSLHYAKVIQGRQTFNSSHNPNMNVIWPVPSQLWGSDWFSRRMWDAQVWQLLKIKWQFLMGFQTSASHCILPSPEWWHASKPQFYRTGHGGASLFAQLSAIRRPGCSHLFLRGCLSHQKELVICAIHSNKLTHVLF